MSGGWPSIMVGGPLNSRGGVEPHCKCSSEISFSDLVGPVRVIGAEVDLDAPPAPLRLWRLRFLRNRILSRLIYGEIRLPLVSRHAMPRCLRVVGPSLSGTLASQDEEATILRSYILIQTDTGRATDVAGAIRGVSGVISTEAVAGPYDVVVLVEVEDIDALGQLVVTAIQSVEGIVRTLTCPVVKL